MTQLNTLRRSLTDHQLILLLCFSAPQFEAHAAAMYKCVRNMTNANDPGTRAIGEWIRILTKMRNFHERLWWDD